MPRSGRNGDFRLVQHELDGQVVDLDDFLEEVREAHAGEILPAGARQIFEPGIFLLPLALEREDHVVGVEIARRREIVGRLELDARPQLERVFEAVVGDLPALGEAGR